MKITKLIIPNYRQFRDFEIDFTYPKGHEKEGQPLEKVCFIGQSGTGKTSLLNIIKAFMDKSYNSNGGFPNTTTIVKLFDDVPITITAKDKKFITDYSPYSEDVWRDKYKNHYQNSLLFISFSAEMLDTMNEIFKKKEITKLNDVFIAEEEWLDILEAEEEELNKMKFFDFAGYSSSNNGKIWRYLLKEVYRFREKILVYKQQIADAYLKHNSELGRNLSDEYNLWLADSENPFIKIANKLDIILNKFNLKIKTDFEFTTFNKIDFIQIQNLKQNKSIPFENWSTGTKQVLLTSIPLISLSSICNNALIFLDEPERSFYPDIQQLIIDFYTKIVSNAQFFVATHSPIIAAQFEPCERIILDFDEMGYVTAQKGITPEGDDPNDILRYDFGIESLLGKKGIEMWDESIRLKTEIYHTENPEKKKELLLKYMKIVQSYHFPLS